MKHENLRWNPGTREWFCAKCGRTSDHANVHDAHKALDQCECQVPSVESPRAAQGTETVHDYHGTHSCVKKPVQNESHLCYAKILSGPDFVSFSRDRDKGLSKRQATCETQSRCASGLGLRFLSLLMLLTTVFGF